MQQYSSLPGQNSQLDANSSTVLTTIEQLRAELWLERSLNQLQSRLNDCLTLALSKEPRIRKTTNDQQASENEAVIFQTVVNELNVAINSNIVAIAIVQPQPQQPVCKICYIPSHPTTHSQPSPLDVMVSSKILRLRLNSEIQSEDLQQLENQQPQTAWRLVDDSLETVGWLITSVVASTNSSNGICVIEQIPQLMAKAAVMCTVALTQLKQIESLQQQAIASNNLNDRNQELQRTNQLKNQFLANTSHEIRTPLSSIIGFTHLLLAQGYDPSRQRHHEYLNIIQSSGKHLLALINDILDLSKIEANQLEVNWETFDVPQLCRNVLALVKEKAANKGLQMRLDLDPNVKNMVADPLRLKQILLNLLFNAVKFTKTGTVGLDVKPEDDFMRFTVWDTGIGISEENQSELFQPYFQIFNPDPNGEEGTGLGLTVTRKLAKIHGGWVEVESEIDRGSRFTIVLPLQQEAQKTDLVKEFELQINNYSVSNSEENNSSEILLVEDDIPNAELIKTYLERLGYQVTWVTSANQMWNALNQHHYPVILIDIILPDANGLTLVKQLRENPQYRNTSIIAQTAMAMKGDRDACLAAGVNDYICKPIDLPLLRTIISQYITAS
ncbi:MAG: hybrid histidine kinase/response regulator HrmK [Rivularia sp. (in: cyanobacteria)]